MKSRLSTLQNILNKMAPGEPPGGSEIIRLGPSTTHENLPCNSVHPVCPWHVCVSVHMHTLKLLLFPIFDSHLFPAFFKMIYLFKFFKMIYLCVPVCMHMCVHVPKKAREGVGSLVLFSSNKPS